MTRPRLRRLFVPALALVLTAFSAPDVLAQRSRGSSQSRAGSARTQQARTQQARTQQARTQQARTQQARTQNAREDQASAGAQTRGAAGSARRAYQASPRERAVQQRLENAGVLERGGATAGDRPLRARLEAAGVLPRVRASMAELRQPSRQQRSPRLSSLGQMERSTLLRTMFAEQAKHRVRLAQLDRLESLARESGSATRVEEVRRLRELEVARQRRVTQRGDEVLGAPGTFDAVVEELETRPAGR
ncbi:hypothetical protein [Engelhardtia mirabilis]|uniref:hypothetical protein n=1 Tax=Engelhardtia mirabilis TaxID=2528011 RepID=UPI0011A692C4